MVVRIAVFAYHSVGCACLKALLPFGDEIAGVITHRDAPGETIWFDSVADVARQRGLPLFFAEDLDRPGLNDLVRRLEPEVIYSFYYRNILPPEVLAVPRLGAFNVHGSLLPAYRGRCPVNWVIVNGEKETGVTLHWMARKADAGDIVAQRRILIDPRETADSLFLKMIPEAAALVAASHPLIREGRAPRLPQDPALATVVPGRRPEDGRIDWRRSAAEIDALVRAVTRPYPGAFAFLNDRKVFLWETLPVEDGSEGEPGRVRSLDPFEVETGRGILRIVAAEDEGGGPLVLEGKARTEEIAVGDGLS